MLGGQVAWRHDNALTGSRGSSIANGYFSREMEADPLGVDVGLYDPFIMWDGGGGSLVEPERPMLLGGMDEPTGRCTLDGMAIGCDQAMRMLDTGSAIQCPNNDCGPRAVTITARGYDGQVIGSTTVLRSQGQSGWDGSLDGRYRVINSPTNPVRFNGSGDFAVAFLNGVVNIGSGTAEIPSAYGHVAVRTASGGRSPRYEEIAALGKITGLGLVPNTSVYRTGKHGFTDEEKSKLDKAFRKIMTPYCLDWLNERLRKFAGREDMLRGRETTDVQFLLQFVEFNKYSPSLTAQDMGITQRSRKEIAERYEERWLRPANAVTLGPTFMRIYLMPTAFYNNGIAGLNDRDLSGIIVHELFHAAGHSEARVKKWNDDIQKHCGNSSDTL